MNRWIWLLALPYVVVQSSPCVEYSNIAVMTYPEQRDCLKHGTRYEVFGMSFVNKEDADDLAAALNYAHERRTEEAEEPTYWAGKESEKSRFILPVTPDDKTQVIKEQPDGNYKWVDDCGQDDCGKKP